MKNRFRKALYDFLIITCFIGMIVGFASLFYGKEQIKKEENLIERLQLKKEEAMKNEESPKEEKQQEELSQEIQILPEYQELYEENNDLYGWIKIEGTNIDYPVMFTPDNPNFYIDKNWEKEICYHNVGTIIWIDGETTDESENIIVYGHNSKSYTTFRSLMNYKDPSYYQEHPYIEFNTLYERQIYEIISVSKTVPYRAREYSFYDHVELNSKEEFNAYVENAKKNAYYQIETTAEYGDQLITLSTCDYWTENARLIIVAKKI